MAPHMISVRLVIAGLGQVIGRDVPQGTTLGDFLGSLAENFQPSSGDRILVGGTQRENSYVLQEDDSVSVAPRNVKAA